MKYKLLATDMDGTLLNGESVITERTRAAIMAAMEKGALFVPSTGRPMGGMRQVRAAFDGDLPMILFNGAMPSPRSRSACCSRRGWILAARR